MSAGKTSRKKGSYFQSVFKSSIAGEGCTFFGRKGKALFLVKNDDPNLIEVWEAKETRFSKIGDQNFDFGPIIKDPNDWPNDGFFVTFQGTTFCCTYKNISIEEARKRLAA